MGWDAFRPDVLWRARRAGAVKDAEGTAKRRAPQATVLDGSEHRGTRVVHHGWSANYRKKLSEESIGFRGWRFSVRIRVEGVAIQRWRGWRFSVDNSRYPHRESFLAELLRQPCGPEGWRFSVGARTSSQNSDLRL